MWVNQRERLATESTEQTDVMLLQLRVNQREQLAAESTEHRRSQATAKASQCQRWAAKLS